MKCPYCGNEDGAKIAGVNLPGVYDGVLWWECWACGGAWHRWTREERERLYLAAYRRIGDGRYPADRTVGTRGNRGSHGGTPAATGDT